MLDSRPAGYALVSPPAAFRLDSDPARTGGLRRWTHRQMLVPRLGYFAGHESRLPYDVDDLLAAITPKPVQLVVPRYDRESPLDLMQATAHAARHAAGNQSDWLTLDVPETYAHFDERVQRYVIEWLNAQTGK